MPAGRVRLLFPPCPQQGSAALCSCAVPQRAGWDASDAQLPTGLVR